MSTNSRAQSVPSTYTPALPLQPTWTSVMSQDVITTDTIPVDSLSATPVAAFINRAAGGQKGNSQAEALVVATLSEGDSSTPQLCHVARNFKSEGGWSLVPLFGGRMAREVTAGTSFPDGPNPTSFGFFRDEQNLYATQLKADGVTWLDPQTVLQGAAANLKVAYSPAGNLVLYANTPDGDLITAYQEKVGGPFVSTVCAMNGGLIQGDFYLCLTDEVSWTLVANMNGQPWVYTGELGANEFSTQEQVTQFSGTLNQVVLGYWNATQNTLMFMLVDGNKELSVWATNDANSGEVLQPIANSTVVTATGHVSKDQTLHIYSVDDQMRLWVLHQDPNNSWNDDGTPNWSPYIPLDQQIARVACDSNPADAPTLFACSAGDFSLRLHTQDPATRMWRSGPVLQDSESAFEVVRFRTEVTVLDGNAIPLPGYEVTVSTASGFSGADISVGGTNYPIDRQSNVPLTTDSNGKLTMSILTTSGLAAPNLVLNAVGFANPLTVQPGAPIHNYLAGNGPLNPTNPNGPLPIFDAGGNTLKSAQVDGQALAPGAGSLAGPAAAAIQHTAQVGLNQISPAVVGYSFSLAEPDGPSFQIHKTKAEVNAQMGALARKEAGSIWNDIENWAGDIWEGIKNGVIQISSFVVSVAGKVASFTAEIGGIIAQGVTLAIKGLEQAAHFIAGVFQAVGAALHKLIDWLKALFDFSAIWRTKMVFEDGLLKIPVYIRGLFALAQTDADNWFAQKEDQVNAAFDQLKKAYTGQTFQDLPNFPQPGQPPSSQTKIAGNATPADFSNNVHHNWLQDKVTANAPPNFGVQPDMNADLNNTWNSFAPKVIASGDAFLAAVNDFKNAITSTIQDPKSFGSVAIPDFLDAIKNMVNSMLELCDALVDLFTGLGELTMDGVFALLNTPLHLGYLNTLWSWIAKQAGQSGDDQLTVSAVLALMAAFPATVAYKLIEGVDAEPFPDGKAPWDSSRAAGAAPHLRAMPQSCLILAAVLQMFYAVPAVISDAAGPAAPGQLSLSMLGLAALIWILTNGLPDTEVLVSGIGAASLVVAAALIVWGTFPKILNAIKSILPSPSTMNDGLIVLFALYGVGRLILVALEDLKDNEQVLAQVLLPLPYIIGLLNLSMFRDDPLAPLFLGTVLIFDAVGFLGGGIVELIDASGTSSLKVATA